MASLVISDASESVWVNHCIWLSQSCSDWDATSWKRLHTCGVPPPGLSESFKQLLCSLCHTVPEAELGWVLTQKLHIPQRWKSAALRTSLLLLLLCCCCESWCESMTRTTSLLLAAPNSLWKCWKEDWKYLGIFLRHFQQIVVTVGSASTWKPWKRCKFGQPCRKKDVWPR